jgi:hypothetical protein
VLACYNQTYGVYARFSNTINNADFSPQLISRKALAARWQCSSETVKRRTREGVLHPVRFNSRMIRYPMSEILRVEQEAGAPS